MYTSSSCPRERRREKEEGEMYTRSLTQIGGILAGIAPFSCSFYWEFSHFKIPKPPAFGGEFHEIREFLEYPYLWILA